MDKFNFINVNYSGLLLLIIVAYCNQFIVGVARYHDEGVSAFDLEHKTLTNSIYQIDTRDGLHKHNKSSIVRTNFWSIQIPLELFILISKKSHRSVNFLNN